MLGIGKYALHLFYIEYSIGKGGALIRSQTYYDVEILGSTQGSGAPRIYQYTVSSRPTKRYVSAFSAIRHRYNYRDDSNTEDGKEEFISSSPDEKYDKDLSDAKVVEKAKPKIQRRRVGTA